MLEEIKAAFYTWKIRRLYNKNNFSDHLKILVPGIELMNSKQLKKIYKYLRNKFKLQQWKKK